MRVHDDRRQRGIVNTCISAGRFHAYMRRPSLSVPKSWMRFRNQGNSRTCARAGHTQVLLWRRNEENLSQARLSTSGLRLWVSRCSENRQNQELIVGSRQCLLLSCDALLTVVLPNAW